MGDAILVVSLSVFAVLFMIRLFWLQIEASLFLDGPMAFLLMGGYFGFMPTFLGWFGWQLATVLFAYRYAPMRGIFHAPEWPRTAMRGPGPKRRLYREPLPWTSGPCSH